MVILLFYPQGTLKGLTGIICDATSNEVLLELHSQFKKVHVLRQNVGLLDSSGHIIADQLGGGGVTPRPSVREPRTPMVRSIISLFLILTRLGIIF